MELRSGRCISLPPPPHGHGAAPRRRSHSNSKRCSRGADRISALPDDLLLEILVRLGCARAAARSSLVSRRWRGLWARLPKLAFNDILLDSLESALPRVLNTSVLDILVHAQTSVHAARFSSLLRAAARVSPQELVLDLQSYLREHRPAVDLPCFDRATSIKLLGWDDFCVQLPPGGGGLRSLERLSLSGCRVDIGALLSRCPRLRVLTVATRGISSGHNEITARSASLQELEVDSKWWEPRIDLVAPSLTRLALTIRTRRRLGVSISAPALEKVSWQCLYVGMVVGSGALWRLLHLALQMEDTNSQGVHLQARVLMLRMATLVVPDVNTEGTFAQEIKNALFTDFTILELHLGITEHVYGAIVLHLLGITEIRCATERLRVVLEGTRLRKACPENCPCDEPKNWRSQTISLTSLKELEMIGFQGADDEFDFLNLILRCAPILKRITLKLSVKVRTSKKRHKKLWDIVKPYPYVECYVYLSSGKQVLHFCMHD